MAKKKGSILNTPYGSSLPFILRFAEPVPQSKVSGHYDYEKQVWITTGKMVGPMTLRTSAPEATDEIDQGPGI